MKLLDQKVGAISQHLETQMGDLLEKFIRLNVDYRRSNLNDQSSIRAVYYMLSHSSVYRLEESDANAELQPLSRLLLSPHNKW